MNAEFSVYQWFMDGSYEEVLRFVTAERAVERALALTRSVGGRIGTTVRVIVTDGGDCIAWEWKFGEGVVFSAPDPGSGSSTRRMIGNDSRGLPLRGQSGTIVLRIRLGFSRPGLRIFPERIGMELQYNQEVEKIEQERLERRTNFISGLRECADWLATHPNVPLPWGVEINSFLENRDELKTVAQSGGGWEKIYTGNFFILRKTFSGGVKYEANVDRKTVCRRVVTGTKVVPARPEQVVEEVEWICDESILGE